MDIQTEGINEATADVMIKSRIKKNTKRNSKVSEHKAEDHKNDQIPKSSLTNMI